MQNKFILLSSFIFFMTLLVGQNPPLADPGEDRIVTLGESVTLDGSGSIDPDGDAIISYIWTSQDNITLVDTESPAVKTFTAPDVADTLVFSLSVVDVNGDMYEPYPSNDLFISEYGEGSSPNQYVELYNGTDGVIDLTGYELWILKGDSNMSWEQPDYILLFNKDGSSSDIDFELGEEGDEMQRVDVDSLMPGETLMIIREGPDFEYSGKNYTIWDRMSRLGGDDPIALINSVGVIIDQVGQDDDPGSAFEVAGQSAATKNHTLVRKGTVVDGNTDWTLSSGGNAEDSEWIVYEEDYFSSVFIHDCRSCDGELNIFVLAAPFAQASYLSSNLLLDESESNSSAAYQVCSSSVTLDASSSTSFTGEIEYEWFEGQLGNGEYDEGEDFIDEGDGVWNGEDFVDEGDGIWNIGEEFTDTLNEVYDVGEDFVDAQNGVWDVGEDFIDTQNGVWNLGEEFTDILNGVYDAPEDFIDMNDNGEFDEAYCHSLVGYTPIEFLSDDEGCAQYGYIWGAEPFSDSNDNGQWDNGEDFIDIPNGVYDMGEEFIDALNGVYDIGEEFIDSLNEEYDEGEDFIDIGNGNHDIDEDFIDTNENFVRDYYCMNPQGYWDSSFNNSWSCENSGYVWTIEEFVDEGDGIWNVGEYFTDALNGEYDEGEDFTDALNGEYDEGEDFTDALNGEYDEGEDFTDALNGEYDEGEDFTDIGNGEYDEGEYFVDIGNGVYDEDEEYIDSFISNKDLCEEEDKTWVMKDQYSFCDRNSNLDWDTNEERNVIPNIFNTSMDDDECIFTGGIWLEDGSGNLMIAPQYDDDVCILNSNELSRRRPSFNTMTESFCDENGDGIHSNETLDKHECFCNNKDWIEGEVLYGDFSFILTVSDGLLDSSPDIVDINIAENLCSQPSANVVGVEYISFCDQNCNYLYDSDYGDSGEIKSKELCESLEGLGHWLSNAPHLVDKNAGVLVYQEEKFEDIGDGIWNEEEDFDDTGNQFYDGPEPFDDVNGNCIWDDREPHQNDYNTTEEAISACQELSGSWTYLGTTLGESFWGQLQNNASSGFNSYYFCDLNQDESWESGEIFYDCNSTRSICEYDSDWEEGLGNGVYDYNTENQEEFIDVDGNCYWSAGEPYLDLGNEEYDEGESFVDIGNEEWDSNESFTDINGNGVYDAGQKVLVSGLNSIDLDPGAQVVTYEWNEISGYLSSDDIEIVDSLSSNGGIISFFKPDFGNAETFVDQNENGIWDRSEPFDDLNGNSLCDGEYGDVKFTLKVTDGSSSSSLVDTLTVKFRDPSAPDIPALYARIEGDYVEGEQTVGIALTWEVNSENSIDDLTGYYDFEGYRLYKSTDGGNTWGTENDKIYINGEFKGWKPFKQWDYTREEDLAHCIYSNDICAEDNRNIDVVGYDPYSYWINIGENTGITHYYFDDDIINGVEYTYALTAYDTGVWTTFESDVTNEMEWYDSNPNHYININGLGISSIESALIDLERGKNISSVVPGYYASDIDFPTFSELDKIIVADARNQGNGLPSYQITNLKELEDVKIQFEIEADPRDGVNLDSFEGLHTANPSLYAFYIGENNLPQEIISHSYEGLLNSEIDSLLDLPGAYSEDNIIYHPIYQIENHEIKFLDDDDGTFTSFDHYTDFISGTRMRFLNPLREYGWTKEVYIDFSDLENLIFYDLSGSSDHIVPVMGSEYFPRTDNSNLINRIGYTLKFNYDNSTTTFDNRPPYTYRIEFSKDAQYMVDEVKQDGLGGCEESANMTFLPFKVINTYTGLEVGLRHIDLGWHNGGLMGTIPYAAPAPGCEDGTSISDPGNYTGDCDCVWSFYEDVVFVGDSVTTSSNIIPHKETTYSFELSNSFNYLTGLSPWSTNSYNEGTKVQYGGMKWISRTEAFVDCNTNAILDDNGNTINSIGSICDGDSEWDASLGNDVCDLNENYIDDNYNGKWDSGKNTDPLCPPGPMFCDTDGDGVSNGGSWKIIYPWEDLVGDIYIDIEPWTWFADGDNWVADIGKLGAQSDIDDEMLAKVTVSPNPYRGSSGYPNNGIYFNHLPTECEINIYTISGERVFRHQFNSEDGPNQGARFYGSYEWDLNNEKGEPVGPGLYIYTVESLDYKNKYIAKFAIVR